MFEEEITKYARMFENQNFDSILAYLEEKKKTDDFEYALLLSLVYNNNILHKILEHKVLLAIFISKQLPVEIAPEDRTRLIYILAKLHNIDYQRANEEMKREFGPNFNFPENIIIGRKTYSWKILAKRANEVKKGIYNNCYLQVLNLVKVLHEYFTLFKETDPDKIGTINKLSLDILAQLNSSPVFGMPYSENRKNLIPKIQQFYRLTNRVNLDIKKIEENPDFTTILDYTLAVHMACDIKLELIAKKMSPNDSGYAFKSLLKHFGEIKFNDLLDMDEIERFSKILPLKTKAR
ncbi:MAG: hypothetical protein M1324_02735 [Patescibacteria group bacterium]|nr:hypothetical protein [Patescibacteria group bacterium]